MGRQHVIKVPDVGEGIAEVELVEWHVAVGDRIAEDQVVADVMTDKASVGIPSPVAGIVATLGGAVGQMLAVGSELMRIEVDGGAAAPVQPPAAVPVAAPPAATPSPTPTPAAAPTPTPTPPPARTPPPPAAAPHAADRSTAGRPIASPSVRARAWELGIALSDVAGSGAGGRILHADLDAAVAAGVPRAEHARPAAPPPAPPAAAIPRREPRQGTQALPVIGLRRRIATRMQEAKRRIPHFSYVEELDVSDAEALRASLNTRFAASRGKLTLLPLLMRAMVLAIEQFPQLNAWFDDDAGVITRHAAVHLGVATQTQHGLLVPVVRHAEALELWGLAAEVARLADAARAGRATRDELSGSTITLSSLGALGGIVSTPVINRPEVAIVGVNRIVERPVVRGGAVIVRQTMNLSSSFDHRVIDGDDAARFIQAVRQLIENPALLLAD